MSTVIGTIKAIIGQAWIVASDGTRRQATEGEQVMRGEQIVTEQGAVTVTLPNGKNLDLGRASHWGDDTTVTTSTESSPPQDLAAAQQAIAEGADPSQVLEATAAGNPVTSSATGEAGDGGEGHTHVVLDLTGQILDPTAGYPTDGIDVMFPGPLEEETLLETDQDVNDTDDDPIITPEPPVPPVLPEASITIDAIAGDNIINMREAMEETTVVSGKTGHDVRPGDVVTVTVNGNHYQTNVQADGSWSVNVNTSDLLASGDVQASVITRDDNGNEATASAQSSVGQAALSVEVEIDPIGGDGWINAEEAKEENTVVSGTVGGDAKAGDVVHLEINGKPYEATVQDDLTWSTEVKTSDLLADPEVNGTITIRDEAGNEATANAVEPVKVDTDISVTLDIDVIAGDGWINAEEAKAENTTISGTVGGDAKAGDVVHLEVNGTPYEAIVQDDLTWSTEVKTSDLLADPEVNGTITITDDAGNEATATAVEPVKVDTDISVTLDIDVIAGDGWINAEEAKAEYTTVSGTVGGDAKAGDVVYLEINGTPYEATVQDDLTWSTEVKTSDLLADPEVNGTITIRDEAGNEATANAVEPVKVDTDISVTLEIDVIAGDGWINAEEAKAEYTTVSGTVGGDAKAGDVVHLEINGKPYEATVQDDLTWITEVKTSDLLADPEVNGTITIRDEAGNEATANAVEPVKVDTDISVTLDIDVIAGDGWINAEEAKAEYTTISGTVGGDAKAGDVVHLEVNGNPYEAVVQDDLTWSTEVKTSDLLADPEVNGTITITDEAGNEATATAVEPVKVDTDISVTLDIDVIAGDGWINAEEAKAENTTISGTVGGDAKAGDVVHLEVNGTPYEAIVQDDLTWSTEVKTSDLLADPEVNGTITIRDDAGNEATATEVEPVKVDTDISVTLDIDVIAGDGWINAEEAKAEYTTVSGTVGGDAKAGDVVHLEINGKPYEATVQDDLTWSTEVKTSDLLADPEVNGTITIRDEAGNEATANAVEPVKVDTDISVTLDIDVIAGDGWINAEEAKAEYTTVSGTVGGDAKAGDVVHLEINGKPYEATVQDDLTWSTEVKTSDLLADPEVNGTITIRDEAGNEATANAVEPVKVDTDISVTLDIDVIAGDGWINAEEAKAEYTTVSGTVGGDAKAGDVVVLEVNGKPYEATVQDDLTWSTEVKTSDLLADPEVNGTITIRDEAGNEATANAVEPVKVDTDISVTLEIDVIAGDGWINAEEAKAEYTTVSGTVGGDAKAGDVVVLEVNGKPYEATVQDDLTWSTEVKTSDLLADPEVNGTITITDDAGNEATATAVEPVKVDTDISVTLDIDVIAGDGWINAEEAKAEYTTISGTVGGDAKAGDVVVLEVNGKPYEATVQDDLTWSTEVKTSDLLADPEVNGTITITDEAGNEATARDNELVKIDTSINVVVTIDPITGDDFLSFAETNKLPGQDSPTIKVTGTVTGEVTTDDFVNVQVGDTVVKVPVQEDGEGNLFWEAEFTADNLMKNPEVSASITVQDEAGNVASSSAERPVTIETGNVITGNEYDNVIEGGDGTSDVIIADTQGFQQEPGQNYNIAFVVDSSGSVGSTDVKAIIKSLTEVFNTLSNNAKLEGAGEVKILLIDFDTQVNYAVSVNLSDPNALKTLTDALAKMTSGGGTNYEDAFKTAANWFHEVGSENSENLTYFITDGKPTYYQSDERTSVDVDGRSGANNVVTLDMSKINYQEGQVVTMNINGTNRTVIDANGNVYSWNGGTRSSIGVVRADGKGGYEISTRDGSGSSTSSTTTSNSLTAFALLMAACSNVEAIGINNGIGANDLKPYDSDGNVMSGIAADELANAILGGDNVQMAGAQDTVHGNAGNDILFGDMVLFGNSNGYAAIKEYVASQLGVSANDLDVAHVSQYINEHPAEFDQSQNDGGKDVLFGGQGDDILYGGGGDDILVGGSGDDVLFGGKGDDILIGDGFDSSADLASHMGTTVGDLTFDKVADYVVQNSDELGAMGSGNDILHGGEGDDILLGGGGNDILNGGLGDDILYGGTGNDTLTGGKGDDILHGGTGSDTFTWLKGDDGHDVIKDFNVAEGDRIDLSELLGEHVDNLDNFLQVTQDNSGNAVIEINTNGQISNGANMSITVEGCSAADISSLLANPDNTSIII